MVKIAKNIYLCSVKEKVGKSLLSIGIFSKLQKEGKKVAYFKPIGVPKAAFSAKADRDVGFILNTIFKTKLPYDIISPVSIPDNYYIDLIDATKKNEYLETIKHAYNELTKNFDYIVIEGAPSIKRFIRVGLDDVSIAEKLGIKELIFVETESSDKCIDDLFFSNKYFEFRNIKTKGVIFNRIDYDYIARIRELEDNHIKRYNIPILGIIELNYELLSLRASEIQSGIGGELINESATSGLSNDVLTIIIGAMNTQAALKYLRQAKKAAVITGGDRTDLALAALNEKISCLILTGFMQPDVSVITMANEKGIPIILSPSDTYTTLKNIDRIKPGIQEDEIQIALELIEKNIDWNLLLK